MDSLDNLIDKFDSMKNTHPNLSKIWIEYLKIKQERIEKFNRHKKKKEHTKFAEGKFKAPKKRSKYKLNINDINNIEEP